MCVCVCVCVCIVFGYPEYKAHEMYYITICAESDSSEYSHIVSQGTHCFGEMLCNTKCVVCFPLDFMPEILW
jgi:hypothetical protein